MSLVDKLLALDANKYKEKQIGEVEIKRLSKMVGEPFIVKVKEVDQERLQELQAMGFDKNGKFDMSKSRNINLLTICAGIVEPELTPELQKHYGAASPKELADILFKGIDATIIADKIAEISNIVPPEEEEETKKE